LLPYKQVACRPASLTGGQAVAFDHFLEQNRFNAAIGSLSGRMQENRRLVQSSLQDAAKM
jgi:hypothetical protein